MNLNSVLRLVAGFFTLLSAVMIYLGHTNWVYFAMFIGVNQIQSAFTNWCPMITMLKKAGLSDDGNSCC